MNCMDFQRALNADPRRLPESAHTHAENCSACAQRLVRQINQEARINAALQVTPALGMEDRILFKVRAGRQQHQQLVATAATVIIGLTGVMVLSWSLSQPSHAPTDIAAIAVEHVLQEPQHLHETVRVSPSKLNELFALVGARAHGSLPVTYANYCDLPNGKGGHVVLETSHGRVTLMLIPKGDTRVTRRRIQKGMIVEVYKARHGSYSLVSPNNAGLIEAKAMLARQWYWVGLHLDKSFAGARGEALTRVG